MAERLVNNPEALMLETRLRDARVLLRRLVDEFELFDHFDGVLTCAHCVGESVDINDRPFEHEPDCAWLAAKRYFGL